MDLLELRRTAIVEMNGDAARGGSERSYDDAAVVRMRAEDGVGICVLATYELV
jgi:hypothetical protein